MGAQVVSRLALLASLLKLFCTGFCKISHLPYVCLCTPGMREIWQIAWWKSPRLMKCLDPLFSLRCIIHFRLVALCAKDKPFVWCQPHFCRNSSACNEMHTLNPNLGETQVHEQESSEQVRGADSCEPAQGFRCRRRDGCADRLQAENVFLQFQWELVQGQKW